MDDAFYATLTQWRRHLHAHPELSFEEAETARFVMERLTEMGVDFESGIGGHGIVATLTQGESNRSVALRADMDALPITEANGFDYVSTVKGVMHACGHDGHTVSLLGSVQTLKQDESWSGTIRFIFQPAEERGGGAKAMLADGLLERFPFERVFGFHNHPGLPTGDISIAVGPLLAMGGRTRIVIEGKAGHAAEPHTSSDAIVAAGQFIVAVQTAISRSTDPIESAVLTLGTVQGGESSNQIAGRVELMGTIRSYKMDVRNRLEAAIRRIAAGVGEAFGVKISVEIAPPGRPCINPPREAAIALEAAKAAGLSVVSPLPPGMGGDDFGFLMEQRPACYVRIGNGTAHGDLHSSNYDFDDGLLPAAVEWYSSVARTALAAED